MPFDEKLTQIYEKYIKTPLEKEGVIVKRADDFHQSTPIFDDILNSIEEADFLITELTGKNPNVFYELGRAHEKKKKVILICQNIADLPFDVNHIRSIIYDDTLEGYENLTSKIMKYLDFLKRNLEFKAFSGGNIKLREKIEEIKKYGKGRITDLLKTEPFANIIKMTHMIYNELEIIVDWDEIEANNILFDFLHYSLILRENIKEKIILLRLLFSKMNERMFGYYKLYERFTEYLKDEGILQIVFDNYISDLIKIFSESLTFDDAGITSGILVKFKDHFTKEHILKIVEAAIDNAQIIGSFKGKPNVKQILHSKLEIIPKGMLDEYKKNYG